jgi:two-component system nitrate/nitrite response regulator NarL
MPESNGHRNGDEQAAPAEQPLPARSDPAERPVAARSMVLVDPDPLARSATRAAIAECAHLVVVGEASSAEEAVRLCTELSPDVALLELETVPRQGAQLVRELGELRRPPLVLAFTQLSEDEALIGALRAGAAGFLSKDAGTDALMRAVDAVLRGEVAISRTAAMRVVSTLRRARQRGTGMRPVRSELTAREWEVFDLMSEGASTRAMAERLVLTEATVYSHVKSILRKLGVHSRAEALAAVGSLPDRRDRRRAR